MTLGHSQDKCIWKLINWGSNAWMDVFIGPTFEFANSLMLNETSLWIQDVMIAEPKEFELMQIQNIILIDLPALF